MSEAQIQAACVTWLWNTYPQTRGLFFAVKNEGAKISYKFIKDSVMEILQNLTNPSIIKKTCRKILDHITGNAINGGKDKAMGMVPGVSDTIFLWAGKALLIEFKTPTGRQSAKQKEWQARAEAQGFRYYIVRSLEDFKQLIEGII